jgi:hypothetical protein
LEAHEHAFKYGHLQSIVQIYSAGGAMAAIIGLIGVFFLLAGFLDVAKVTDVALNWVSITQIHTLPLLNQIPSGWSYMIVGLIIMLIAGAMYRRRVTYINNENE